MTADNHTLTNVMNLLPAEAGNDERSDAASTTTCSTSSSSGSANILVFPQQQTPKRRRSTHDDNDLVWDNHAISTCFQMSVQSYRHDKTDTPFVDWNPLTSSNETTAGAAAPPAEKKDWSSSSLSILSKWKPQELLLPPWLHTTQQPNETAEATITTMEKQELTNQHRNRSGQA